MSLGTIKDYTPNFNLIIPEFNISGWHDYLEENFRSIDALFYNLFGINNYSGIWEKLTSYTAGQVVFIGEDTNYSGRLVKVLVDHTTTNDDFSTFFANNPTYYEFFADASTAQYYAQQAKDWAVKMDGPVEAGLYSSKYYADLVNTMSTEITSLYQIKDSMVNLDNIKENVVNVDTNKTNINVNANNINSIINTSNNISNIISVADNETNINSVNSNKTNINTIANNLEYIQDTATNINDIITCSDNINAIQNAPQAALDAQTAATNAINAETNASTYATQAANSAQSAQTYSNNSQTSATNAVNSATSAASSASSANTYATNASVSAVNAQNFATSAQNASNLAKDWATKTDGPISGGKYSAKYYAENAETIVSNKANTDLSNLSTVGENRFNTKQDILVSGTNIKTINNQSLLGSGNITISGGVDSVNGKTGTVVLTTSDLTNDSGYVTSSSLATVATSGDYDDLTNKPTVYHPDLLSFQWSDHLLNNVSWLRADTFSWQDGTVYEAAYNHLSADISGKTLQSETIGAVTVQFYLADDGHKICPASEESSIASIYTNTGVSWYYILDTANERFKLPRINPAKKELIQVVRAKGNGKSLGLSNGNYNAGLRLSGNNTSLGVYNNSYDISLPSTNSDGSLTFLAYSVIGLTSDSTKSGIISDMSESTSVYAGQKYLYFYVGDYTQTAIEQTAGLNAELFNSKLDLDLENITNSSKETIVGWGMPDYSAGVSVSTSPYTATYKCLFCCHNYNSTVYVNGNIVGYGGTTVNVQVVLDVGDVVSGNTTMNSVVYPLKGVNND